MATSIRDLTQLLQQESRYGTDTRRRDALYALAPLGRALDRLIVDGLDVSRNAAGEIQARDLADACQASASIPGIDDDTPGRLCEVAAAVADLLAVLRGELDRDQRWVIVTELAQCVRVLTVTASDDPGIPPAADLRWTHRAARTICVTALRDPPAPRAQAVLDRAVPAVMSSVDGPGTRVAAESLLAISDRLRRVVAGQAPPPTLHEVFAVIRAADATARAGAAVLATLRNEDTPGPIAATDIWRDVRVALRPFVDAALAATPTTAPQQQDLSRSALTVHLGLRDGVGRPGQAPLPAAGGIGDLQRMLHELPPLANSLVAVLGELADRGELHALASQLRFSHLRLDEHLHNRPVIARRPDLDGAVEVLAQAAGLAARLAVDLTRAACGGLPQDGRTSPDGLIAANRVRAEQHDTPTERWRSLARSIDPVLTRDPSWPRLASAIEQAHNAHLDVAAELPRLARRFPLDDERPAPDLLYRLLHHHPALQTPLPAHGYRGADTTPRPTPQAAPAAAITRDPPRR